MTLSLTTSLSSTITKSELEGNFTSLQNKFGSIDNSDIKSGAGIAISKLAATKEYTTVVLANTACTVSGTGQIIAYAPLPGMGTGTYEQADWVLKAANWMCSDGGSGAATFDVALGYFNSGTWADVSVLIDEEPMTISSDGNGCSGSAAIDNSAVPYHDSRPYAFVFRIGDDDGTGVLNSAGFIAVTLLLERDIQA